MLVLSRQRGERLIISDAQTGKVLSTITVADIRGDKVRLGINAEKCIQIDREEVYKARLADAAKRKGGA